MEAHGVGKAALEQVVVLGCQLLHDVRQACTLSLQEVSHSVKSIKYLDLIDFFRFFHANIATYI